MIITEISSAQKTIYYKILVNFDLKDRTLASTEAQLRWPRSWYFRRSEWKKFGRDWRNAQRSLNNAFRYQSLTSSSLRHSSFLVLLLFLVFPPILEITFISSSRLHLQLLILHATFVGRMESLKVTSHCLVPASHWDFCEEMSEKKGDLSLEGSHCSRNYRLSQLPRKLRWEVTKGITEHESRGKEHKVN